MPEPRSLAVRVETTALVLTVLTVIALGTVGVLHRGYDYDEVTRAHSVWLAAQGLRPYRDFFECHPPYFLLLSPVMRLCPDPCDALTALRLVSALGNLLFLGALGALAATAVTGEDRRWAWLGVVVVGAYPVVLDFEIEFRIDGWGYALAAWGLYRFRRRPTGLYRHFEVGLLTGIATGLFCPKLAFLPPLIVLCEPLVAWESIRTTIRGWAAYGAGVGCAVGLFVGFLAVQGIGLDRTTQLLGRYHAVSSANASAHFGLVRGLFEHQVIIAVVLAGVFAWVVACLRRRSRPDAYEAGLAVWLVAQALLVAYPYKQYFAPWYLFASGFLVYLGRGLAEALGRVRVAAFVAVCLAATLAVIPMARAWYRLDDIQADRAVIRWMNRVTRPGDPVVAAPPVHPIDRPDTFFVWFNTADVRGFDSERILGRLPAFRGYATTRRSWEELAAHPPAVIALSSDWRMAPYTSGQQAALSDFLRLRGYFRTRVGNASFALRPDRYEEARRRGLLE